MIEIATVMLGVILAQISPGPNLVAVASSSLSSGRTAGIFTALGVAAAIFFWASLFALGVGAILVTFPEFITAMRFIGGFYLLYIGINSLRSTFLKNSIKPLQVEGTVDYVEAFRKGLLVNLSNPKTAMMWVAISMYLGASNVNGLQLLFIGIAVAASAVTIYSAYAFIFSTNTVVRGYGRFYRIVDTLFGCVFGAVGGRLLLDGIDDLQQS